MADLIFELIGEGLSALFQMFLAAIFGIFKKPRSAKWARWRMIAVCLLILAIANGAATMVALVKLDPAGWMLATGVLSVLSLFGYMIVGWIYYMQHTKVSGEGQVEKPWW